MELNKLIVVKNMLKRLPIIGKWGIQSDREC